METTERNSSWIALTDAPDDPESYKFINFAMVQQVTDFTGDTIKLWFSEVHTVTIHGQAAQDLFTRMGFSSSLADGTKLVVQSNVPLAGRATKSESQAEPQPEAYKGPDSWMA